MTSTESVQKNTRNVSIVLPARNEADNLSALLPQLKAQYPHFEIFVVDDGSTDDTARICHDAGVRIHRHPYSMGNGAAIKSGARLASGDTIIFMDADGQHRPEYARKLLEALEEGYDMAVGARSAGSHANFWRRLANGFYNRLASIMAGHRIADLTSGLRAVNAEKFREFLPLLPNGFSYPTTITMAFFRSGYAVHYVPIIAEQRGGKSHIQPLKDGLRFVLIIVKIGTLYSPLKFFVPLSAGFFLTGLGYYLYTFFTMGRFTNMSALLFTTAILTFLIGLVSEQITTLMYRK